jgi:putative ABC transport system permease protein
MDVVVRSDAPASALLPVVRQKVRELDPELPVATVRTMEEWVSNSAAQPRLSAELVAVFAFMALAIAAVGIYGVMAFSVGQRTRELGIRMALGARPDTLVWVVVKQGMDLALAGLAAGVVGAALLARAVDSLVYGVAPHDPRTMVAVAALLSGVALLACWVPARRASRLDPLIALRQG